METDAVTFTTVRKDGIVWVDRKADQAFRRALMAGVPPTLRTKMQEALTDIPGPGAMEYAVKYFGGAEKIAEVKNQIAPLLIELDRLLVNQIRLSGLFDWLNVTNLGNSAKLIAVFKEWSEMKHG